MSTKKKKKTPSHVVSELCLTSNNITGNKYRKNRAVALWSGFGVVMYLCVMTRLIAMHSSVPLSPPKAVSANAADDQNAVDTDISVSFGSGRVRRSNLVKTDRKLGGIAGVVNEQDDSNCPFRNSSLYRKVFVYPDFGDAEHGWGDPNIMSPEVVATGRDDAVQPWPWIEYEKIAKHYGTVHYDATGSNAQYATEQLVKELLTNPDSCLRTYDPDGAALFYVPYMPSVEIRRGSDDHVSAYVTRSPYGEAILDILEKNDYDAWELRFGFTSKYWHRRNGADHILVFGEPFAGLWHAAEPRGNYRYVKTHQNLAPPIIVSVELSTTFVEMYPKCARKNILLPYPSWDGGNFNSRFDREANNLLIDAKPFPNVHGRSFQDLESERLQESNWDQVPPRVPDIGLVTRRSVAALRAERIAAARERQNDTRPAALFYSGGEHGYCETLRKSLNWDYKKCSQSVPYLRNRRAHKRYEYAMRLSTFCLAPCGDSPSAKRMFDSILAGCIPVVLSHDFVWPFTNEFEPSLFEIEGSEFALRYSGSDFLEARLNVERCEPWNASNPSLEATLQDISVNEIRRLRNGLRKARDMYSWYKPRPDLVDNPLREGVLPDGGTAHALVRELEKRAGGVRWKACQAELKLPRSKEPDAFKV